MDPNETLRMFARALLEENADAAREFHSYLKEWMARGGFEPAWGPVSKKQFQSFNYATGRLE